MKPTRAAAVLFLTMVLLIPNALLANQHPPQKQMEAVVSIFTISENVDSDKVADDLSKAFSSRLPELAKVRALDFRSALSTEAKAVLKDEQMKRLLALPELIARTDRVRRNLQADGLVAGQVDLYGKSGKSSYISVDLRFYDFRGNGCEEVEIGIVDFKSEARKKEFFDQVAEGLIKELSRTVPGLQPSTAPASEDRTVVCNKSSRLFHSSDCHHLPGKSSPAENLTRAEAEAAGYKPCIICYPEMRKRISPDSTEAMLGTEVAGFIEYYYRRSNDPERHARLERIGRKILDANAFTRRNYIFTALNSDEVNAFAAPAGYIYVTIGMMDAVESDDELASVLAHEIAHVEQEHGIRQYRRAQKAATLGVIMSILSGQDLSLLADFVRELVLRGYDRRYEREADRYGYMYLQRGPYDSEAEFMVLGKLQDMEIASNAKIISWMRTHPKSEERIKSVTDLKNESEAASQYLAELNDVDAGLASAVQLDKLRYVESIDRLKAYVEAVKRLP